MRCTFVDARRARRALRQVTQLPFYFGIAAGVAGCMNVELIGTTQITGKAPSTDASLELSIPAFSANTPYGTQVSVTATLTNVGTAPATALSVPTLAAPFAILAQTCGTTLAVGASCTYQIQFTSPGQDDVSQTLSLSYTSGTQTVEITGTVSATGAALASTLSVAPIYPVNGARWNDYVTYPNHAVSPYEQTDAACAGTEAGYHEGCLHGAEKLKVVLPAAVASCAGITASDALGAFDWFCHVIGGQAWVVSRGLKAGKGLRDLVDPVALAWRANSVTIQSAGNPIGQTTSTAWWNNAIAAAPDSTGARQTLSAASTIYVLQSSQTGYGFDFAASNAALIMPAAVSLTWNGSGSATCDLNGDYASGGVTCLVNLALNNFLWIEGTFAQGGSVPQVQLDVAGYFAVVNVSNLYGGTFAALTVGKESNFIENSNFYGSGLANNYGIHQEFQNLKFSGTTGGAFSDGGTNTIAADITVENSAQAFYLAGGSNESFIRPHMFNSNSSNIGFWDNTGEVFVGSLVAGSATDKSIVGVGGGSAQVTFLQSSFVNNAGDFYSNTANAGITLVNTVFANDYGSAVPEAIDFDSSSPAGAILYNTVLSDGTRGLYASTDADGISLEGFFNVGNNSVYNCQMTGGSSPEVVSGTCTDTGAEGSDTYHGTPGATLHLGVTTANSFVGEVTTTDSANLSNLNGVEALASITDWLDFANPFRGWGLNGAFPSAASQGDCASGTCRIWDYSLQASDTVLLNRSGNGKTANDPFVPGAACPAAANGNVATTDQFSTPHTFLTNAVEVVFDSEHNPSGNNNGLCESGETCVYSPNLGAYQGSGDPFAAAPCVFSDGTVSGVKLYGFPVNGE